MAQKPQKPCPERIPERNQDHIQKKKKKNAKNQKLRHQSRGSCKKGNRTKQNIYQDRMHIKHFKSAKNNDKHKNLQKILKYQINHVFNRTHISKTAL